MTLVADRAVPLSQPAPISTGDTALVPNAPRGGRRFRTPTVLQMEATECGAASLAMILARMGRWVPLEELRVACDVSRDGSKAANILRAGRQYGLVAKGYRRSPETIANLPFPMIVFWNFNHFIVLEGIDHKRGKVWLNDPASGPRTIGLKEFDEGFTGVVLAFRKDDTFTKGGRKPGVAAPLLSRLGGSTSPLAFVLLATLLLVVPGLVIPVFSMVFVDHVLVGDNGAWLKPLLFGMAATLILNGALTWLQQTALARLELKLALNASATFFWHVLRLPETFFSQRYAGDISNRVGANDQVAAMLSGQLATNVVGLVTIVFFAAVMLSYDAWLTLIGVTLALLNLVVLRAVARVREDSSRRLVSDQGRLAAASISGIQLIETLKAGGAESDFFSRWSGLQAKYLNAMQDLSRAALVASAAPVLLSGLTTAAILAVGGYRVVDGALSVGALVAFQSLMQQFSNPIRNLVGLGGDIQQIKGSLARISDVESYRTSDRLADTASVFATARSSRPLPPKLRGRVELQGLTFGYNRSAPPIVEDLDLAVEPGQRVALIGGSGSGKSTIGKLICGLHEPWSGNILFDGIPLCEMPHAYFANSVATVDQDIFLFAGTVRENVSMWDASVSEATITNALRDACILDAVEARPGRYDAEVLEGGANFSGGQRQRLEIARALAGNPSTLILDEATSALDPVVEKRIDENLRRRGCTTIIVAHRLSTIRDCDEIIVLDRGRVAQRGRHEEMVGHDGPYQRLIGTGEA